MQSPRPLLNSTLLRSIGEEFDRLCAPGRAHLALPELLKLRFSQVPVANLAVLWVLDRWGRRARLPPTAALAHSLPPVLQHPHAS